MLLLTVERIVRDLESDIESVVALFSAEFESEIQRVMSVVEIELRDAAVRAEKKEPSWLDVAISGIKRCAKRFVDLQDEEKLLLAKRLEMLLHLQRRQKDYARLHQCQTEWIGFKPRCCSSPAVAVPVGCNHRLCFLCNSHRAEKYRDRVRLLFDRLQHPVFLTLTIPNLGKISKRSFSRVRVAFNKFRKAHSGWMRGGIFSFETTYNESDPARPWHLHAHCLIDSATALPVCRCPRKFDSASGFYRREHTHACEFVRFKRRLEFDWLCLTQGRTNAGERWRPADFNYWFAQTWADAWKSDSGRDLWNLRNRRVLDIRRVTDRKKAAYEVLKYVTKASAFAHNPRAVDEFISAVKGTRMLQTFGTWYGFKFPDDVNTWGHLECGCGKNDFERIGKMFREAVYMNPVSGQWYVRADYYERHTGPPG